MKTENPNDHDGRLSQALGEWKVEAPLPPRFNEQVWRRIEQSAVPAVNPFELLRNWIAQSLARPKFALGYAMILLLAGLLAGLWQAHAAAQRTDEALSARYVRMVDPYQMPRP